MNINPLDAIFEIQYYISSFNSIEFSHRIEMCDILDDKRIRNTLIGEIVKTVCNKSTQILAFAPKTHAIPVINARPGFIKDYSGPIWFTLLPRLLLFTLFAAN